MIFVLFESSGLVFYFLCIFYVVCRYAAHRKCMPDISFHRILYNVKVWNYLFFTAKVIKFAWQIMICKIRHRTSYYSKKNDISCSLTNSIVQTYIIYNEFNMYWWINILNIIPSIINIQFMFKFYNINVQYSNNDQNVAYVLFTLCFRDVQ